MSLILFCIAPVIVIIILWLCQRFNISIVPPEYKSEYRMINSYKIPNIDSKHFKWSD